MAHRNPAPRWTRNLASGVVRFDSISCITTYGNTENVAYTDSGVVAIFEMSAKPSTPVERMGEGALGSKIECKKKKGWNYNTTFTSL